MLIIRKKRQLEMAIQSIPSHPNPDVSLEQYSTPATIASDILWNAYTLDDIESRTICDLACGTGIFGISSILINGKYAVGIDIDTESLSIGCVTASKMDIPSFYKGVSRENIDLNKPYIEFVKGDITSISSMDQLDSVSNLERFETLIQNPPFGSQEKTKKGIDRKFIDFAMNSADVIYSFHMRSTEEFISNYFEKLGGKITHKFHYKFPIKKIYDFHKKESKDVDVVVFRVLNID